jgi:hypothetical protein
MPWRAFSAAKSGWYWLTGMLWISSCPRCLTADGSTTMCLGMFVRSYRSSQAASRIASQTVGWGKITCSRSATRSSCSSTTAAPQISSDA